MAQRLNGEWSDSEGNILSPLPNPSKIANNCVTTEAGYVLDARQGKALKEGIDAVNQNLGIQFKSVRPYVQCKIQAPLAAYTTINITKDISSYGYTKPPIALLSSTYLCSSTIKNITTSILEVTISNLLNYASTDCFASYTLLEIK